MTFNFDTQIDRYDTGSAKYKIITQDGKRVPTDTQWPESGPERMIQLWVADMDFATPQAVTDALMERMRHPIYGYTTPEPHFWETLLTWIKRRYGWAVDPNTVSLSPGVLPAISILVDDLTEPGDNIILQRPIYPPFTAKVELNDRVVANNQLIYDRERNRYLLDFESLERLAADPRTTMTIFSNPHNPTGRVWTPEELTRFAEICIKHDVIIISDELHCDLIYPGEKFTPMATLSPEIAQNVITCMAPSKSFNLAGLKYAHIICENEGWHKTLRAGLARMHISGLNAFGIVAAEAAYTHGEPWLEAVNAYIAANYAYVRDRLAAELPQVRAAVPEGTYLLWLDFNDLGLEHAELLRLVNEVAKVHLNDGLTFGPEGDRFLRMNIATPRANLAEALDRLVKIF